MSAQYPWGYCFLLPPRWSFSTYATSGPDEATLDVEGNELFHDIAHSSCHCIALLPHGIRSPAKARLGAGRPRPHLEAEE